SRSSRVRKTSPASTSCAPFAALTPACHVRFTCTRAGGCCSATLPPVCAARKRKMAPNTPRGIQHQASALEREQFNVVLLDVRMPEIDGIDVLLPLPIGDAIQD